jgi:hypothetical protein
VRRSALERAETSQVTVRPASKEIPMSFWDIVWFIFITWAFVAYLMVMFSIIGDIFRDSDMSGWAKAAWCLFLVFVPFITALVYIGIRGRSMAERSARSSAARREQQDQYIRDVAGKTSATDQITQAHALFDGGVISQEEYDTLKTKALAGV